MNRCLKHDFTAFQRHIYAHEQTDRVDLQWMKMNFVENGENSHILKSVTCNLPQVLSSSSTNGHL